jgi:L-fucose mutarotase
MLKGIDPQLNADVLQCLRAMGHGDALVISDTNFPADSVARETVLGKLLRMENLTSAEAIGSILSVLPLDTFVDDFAMRMEVVDAPDEIPSNGLPSMILHGKAMQSFKPVSGVSTAALSCARV